eukprot:820521_1
MADLPNTIAMDDLSDEETLPPSPNKPTTDVHGYLVRIDASGNHQTPFILTKSTTTIGRKKNNDIILTNNTISSNHAEIEIDISNKEAFIIDLNSTNKTRTGRQLPSNTHKNNSIKSNRECIIRSGDYITFGDVHFIFYHEEDYTSQSIPNNSKPAKKKTCNIRRYTSI